MAKSKNTILASLLTAAGDIAVSGSGSLTGDLTVQGRLTAQEYHSEIVSSSILYTSGSTKFGDSADDTHQFTGSVNISGSILVNGVAAVGPQGATGSQGATGIQGSIGPQGNQGPIGPQGATGTQGATGAQGFQGSTGAQGDTGTANINGTGFVKADGATISYDNSTYLTTSSAGTTYVPYTGATSSLDVGTNDLSGRYLNANGSAGLGGVLHLKQDAAYLARGNGYSTIASSGILFQFFAYTGASTYKDFALRYDGLTDNTTRIYSLPDASGTLALTSNLSGMVTGTGTTNYLPKFTGTSTIGNSAVYENNSGFIGIGTTNPLHRLEVAGNISINGGSFLDFANGDVRFVNSSGLLSIQTYNLSTGLTTKMVVNGAGNVGIGITDLGPDGLSLPGSFNYSWSEGSGNAYAVLFRQRNSAATVMASGYKRSNTGAFASSFGISMSRAAIAVGYNNGSIAFFSDSATNVANGTDISPSERLTIINNGKVGIGETSPDNTYQGLTIKGTDPSLRLKTTSGSGWVWTEYVTSTGVNNFSMGVNQTLPYFGIKAGAGLDNPNFVMLTNGNIGINRTDPSFYLDVYANTANALYTIAQFENRDFTSGTRSFIRVRNWLNSNGSYSSYFGQGQDGKTYIIANDSGRGGDIVIDGANGNVGIGTNSPSGKLSVEATGNHITLRAPGATAGKFWALDVTTANQFYLINNAGTQYLTITDGGNIGIGTASPNFKLEVNGNIYANGDIRSQGIFRDYQGEALIHTNTSAVTLIGSSGASTSRSLAFFAGNSQYMVITTLGQVGIGTGSPARQFVVSNGGANGLEITPVSSGTIMEVISYNRATAAYTPLQFESSLFTFNRGNVGIGTYSPAGELHIVNASGTSQPVLELQQQNSGSNILQWRGSAGTYLGVIQNDGRVGIGITTPNAILQVRGPNATGVFFDAQNDGAAGATFSRINASSFPFNQYTFANGNVGIGTSSPQQTLSVEGSIRANRSIYNWYQAGTNSWDGFQFLHLKTNMWAGGSPNGNTEYTMSLFYGRLYSYSSAFIREGHFGFHNWSGTFAQAITNGNFWSGGYTSSDGFVVLVVAIGGGTYLGVTIDWHQAFGYPLVQRTVTAATPSNSSTGVF